MFKLPGCKMIRPTSTAVGMDYHKLLQESNLTTDVKKR